MDLTDTLNKAHANQVQALFNILFNAVGSAGSDPAGLDAAQRRFEEGLEVAAEALRRALESASR